MGSEKNFFHCLLVCVALLAFGLLGLSAFPRKHEPSASNYPLIVTGMSEAGVAEILGPPARSQTLPGRPDSEPMRSAFWEIDNGRQVEVVFQGGRVIRTNIIPDRYEVQPNGFHQWRP